MNNGEMKMDNSLRGKSSKARLTRLWLGVVSVVLVCASAQVAAQVCESERQQLRAATGQPLINIDDMMKNVITMVASSWNFKQDCDESTKRRCDAFSNGVASTSSDYGDALRLRADIEKSRLNGTSNPQSRALHALTACVALHMAAQVKPTSANTAINTTRPSPVIPAPANRPANTSPDAMALQDATALGQKRQADVDRARQNKPKRHVLGAEASRCLTPQAGGGVVNACAYAVEYSYCVFRPVKDTWSEAFDCEKSKGGSWQIGPGPNSRSVMHTAGETTYWFACKWGDTLARPDGVSPADIEFQRGRGLLGRCAEWGAGRG